MELADDSRSLFLALMLVMPAIACVNSFVHNAQLKAFLDRTPEFSTYQNITDFEVVVARQMYAALLQIALLASPGIIFVFGFVVGILAVGDVAYVVLPAFVVLALGVAFKQLENRVKSIPVSDPVLEERRDHIVKVWNSKALPDW
jgi:hypothetical protein